MMDSDLFRTQRDVGSAAVTELRAEGFDDAVEIGRGGFGIVFRCTQIGLDRTVAIKVLTAELEINRERFLRELRAMGRLTGHPNIVDVLQVGETESGYLYLVMPYQRQGSLEARIRRLGLLPADDVLRIGMKLAGALETVHRVGIVHRDVKPANILLTDYGEPLLSDFGIAHITGGFETATGTFTGSPAFTAPEILSGDPPSRASDVYGLGATLFAALTGHAAYERGSGEQMVAQFLRIASEPVPDLRDSGIPEDVSAVVEKAMARNPVDRPSAAALGDELRQIQACRGFAVDEMAVCAAQQSDRPAMRAAVWRAHGNLPLELNSFVDRRTELTHVKNLLSTSRLVTLTGVGGVGKTRLALRAATNAMADYTDGVWLVELGELRDASLLDNVVASSLGVRDESVRPSEDVLIDLLCPRSMLLILDNCEHVVDAAAKLAERLLRTCPGLHILATGRERLGIAGESVLPLSPLACPAADPEPTLRGRPSFGALALFAERATEAAPNFELTDDNRATVARICSKLDGIPLAIELAAARLRAMSAEQLLERLADRYALLTRGSRGAPMRQQTLSCSVGWSYDLCTPAEQDLWGGLSLFAGDFELEAAEYICGDDLVPAQVLDLLLSLVDKSILIRSESDGCGRFRLLETLREYGKEQIRQTDRYLDWRRRHVNWYRQLARDAAADWFSPRQLDWLERLERETANLREALRFSVTDSPEAALEIVGALHPFGIARGVLSETGHWLDCALDAAPREPTMDRIRALYGAAIVAGLQADVPAAAARVAEGHALVERIANPEARGMMCIAEGFTALVGGEFNRACVRLEDALDIVEDPSLRVVAMALQGWGLELQGEIDRALIWQEKALAVTQSHGELVYREYSLWDIGIGWWRRGNTERAERLLKEALRVTRRVNDPRMAAANLEGLAWIASENHNAARAVVLMTAAESLARAVGASTPTVLPNLVVFHDECERRTREILDSKAYDAARQQGSALSYDAAVAYGLGE